MSTVVGTKATGARGEGVAANNSNSALGRDEFMKLLLTQLQHQDPVAPMKDQEFAAQMAQIASLESMQNLSTQFEQFMALQSWTTQLGQATGLIGKNVTLVLGEDRVTGQVTAVRIADGVARVVVDGKEYDTAALVEVTA